MRARPAYPKVGLALGVGQTWPMLCPGDRPLRNLLIDWTSIVAFTVAIEGEPSLGDFELKRQIGRVSRDIEELTAANGSDDHQVGM